MPYHAVTGCDAVSDIVGHGKGSAWNAFCLNPDLIANLGKGDFHDETYSSYARSSSAVHHTQVELSSPRKNADKTQTIALETHLVVMCTTSHCKLHSPSKKDKEG